jgi:hypothetical protein
VGVPTWTFGDGTGGDGLAVSHAYTRPGSYVAHVTFADGSGNVASLRLPLVVTAERAVLTSVRFAARWRQSRVRGALRVAGTAPVAGTYAVDVSTTGKRRLHVSLKLGQGAFSRTLALPGTLLPGSYRVALLPASTLLEGSSLLAKLAAPVEGVADLASFSRRRSGAATRTVQDASSLWARFHLAAVPQGKPLTLTWYRLVEGKRVAVRTVTRKPAAHIRDSLAVRGLRGTITVILTRSGKVILQRSALVRSTVGPRVARGSPGTSRPG